MTRPQDPSDRDAILARRALFLSTALAALHCSSGRDSSIAPPRAISPTAGSSAVTTQRPPAKTLPAWTAVMLGAPPRGSPPGLSQEEQAQFHSLEQSLDGTYSAIRTAWEGAPGCDATDPACRPRWRELGSQLKTIFDRTRRPSIGGCGGARGLTASVQQRSAAHNRFARELTTQLQEHLTAVAESSGPLAGQEWQKILANAVQTPPMPCLSPCPLPEISDLMQRVAFEQNDANLSADHELVKPYLEGLVASYQRNTKPSTIVVRGHADANEKAPEELARTRAKAVVAWLIKQGIPKSDIREVSMGSRLPVERSDNPSLAAANRRVDFEAVPR